nr:hypothetical protein [uncultured Desulfobulbus sp.]
MRKLTYKIPTNFAGFTSELKTEPAFSHDEYLLGGTGKVKKKTHENDQEK